MQQRPAWLAANRPDLVRAIVLEDPPLFAAEYPRIKTTIPYRSFATCTDAVRDGVDDFLRIGVDDLTEDGVPPVQVRRLTDRDEKL